MRNLLVLLFLVVAYHAFAGPATFQGDSVKIFKDKLLFNSGYSISAADSDDPTVVAKDGLKGSTYIRSTTGVMYIKQDDGLSTNWSQAANYPLDSSSVSSSLLTGFVSGAGTVSATDSILDAIENLDGNDKLHDTLDELNDVSVSSGDFGKILYYGKDYIWRDIQPLESTGAISGAEITDNLDGSVTIADGYVATRESSDYSGPMLPDTIDSVVMPLDDLLTNYIYIRNAGYGDGEAEYDVTTDRTILNNSSNIPIYRIYRSGINLHIVEYGNLGSGLANKLHQRIDGTEPFIKESGLVLSESGTRVIEIENGVAWHGAEKQTLAAVSSASDADFFWYHVGGVWTVSVNTNAYNNTQYDNGTNLTALGAGRYAVNWVFRGVETSSHIYYVLGNSNYTLSQAQASTLPANLPEMITSHALLVGRIIVQRNDATATEINQITTTALTTGGSVNHNETLAKQGGTADEYYHMTLAEWNVMTNSNATSFAVFNATGDLAANPNLQYNDNGGFNSIANITPAVNAGLRSSYSTQINLSPTATLTDSYVMDYSNISYTNNNDFGSIYGLYSDISKSGTGDVDGVTGSIITINMSNGTSGPIVGRDDNIAVGLAGNTTTSDYVYARRTNVGINEDHTTGDVMLSNDYMILNSSAVANNLIGHQSKVETSGTSVSLTSDLIIDYIGATAILDNVSGISMSQSINAQTDNYTGLSINPNGTTSPDLLNGLQINTGFADKTDTFNGITVTSNSASVGQYRGLSIATGPSLDVDVFEGISITPTIDTLANYSTGIRIQPQVTLAQSAFDGIYVDTSSVIPDVGQEVRSINAKGNAKIDGDLEITGDIAFGGTFAPATLDVTGIGGYDVTASPLGNPDFANRMLTQMNVDASESALLADTFGFGLPTILAFGDDSIITTNDLGGFSLGIAALGMPMVLALGSNATVDQVSGAVFALSMMGSGTGGTVDKASVSRAIAFWDGGLTTINRLYGYEFIMPAPAATKSWAFYSGVDVPSYYKGGIVIGSTDEPTNSSVGLEIISDSKALVISRMTTAERTALTAINGMIVYDTTLEKFYKYEATAWSEFGSGGGSSATVSQISANTNLLADTIYIAQTTGGSITLTLPSPVSGTRIIVKKASSANSVIINPFAAETIDGAASHTISIQGIAVELVSDGTNWYLL